MEIDLKLIPLQESVVPNDLLKWCGCALCSVGDKIIIMAYAQMTPEEVKDYHPNVVFVDEKIRCHVLQLMRSMDCCRIWIVNP